MILRICYFFGHYLSESIQTESRVGCFVRFYRKYYSNDFIKLFIGSRTLPANCIDLLRSTTVGFIGISNCFATFNIFEINYRSTVSTRLTTKKMVEYPIAFSNMNALTCWNLSLCCRIYRSLTKRTRFCTLRELIYVIHIHNDTRLLKHVLSYGRVRRHRHPPKPTRGLSTPTGSIDKNTIHGSTLHLKMHDELDARFVRLVFHSSFTPSVGRAPQIDRNRII